MCVVVMVSLFVCLLAFENIIDDLLSSAAELNNKVVYDYFMRN